MKKKNEDRTSRDTDPLIFNWLIPYTYSTVPGPVLDGIEALYKVHNLNTLHCIFVDKNQILVSSTYTKSV
jgi:hypothetical protein